MGKISDALEKYQEEKLIPFHKLPDDQAVRPRSEGPRSERLVCFKREDPEAKLAREISSQNNFSQSLVMLSSPDSADAETFKLLRGQILFPRYREIPRSILVTSTFPAEGKTFTAANLATAIAISVDEHVLLIDADMRRARIHHMFGFKNVLGLHEYLIGEKEIEEIVVKTAVNKLSLVPAGRTPRNPSELLSSNMMAKFLKEAKERYKDWFIIIDSPPTHITAEAKFLAQYADAVLFVMMANKTPRKDAQKAIEGIGRDKVLGIVFNGFNQTRKSYHKYYEKYYKSE